MKGLEKKIFWGLYPQKKWKKMVIIVTASFFFLTSLLLPSPPIWLYRLHFFLYSKKSSCHNGLYPIIFIEKSSWVTKCVCVIACIKA